MVGRGSVDHPSSHPDRTDSPTAGAAAPTPHSASSNHTATPAIGPLAAGFDRFRF